VTAESTTLHYLLAVACYLLANPSMSPRPGNFMHKKTYCECRICSYNLCMLATARHAAQRRAVCGPLLTTASAPGLSGIASRSPASFSAISAAGLSRTPPSAQPASYPSTHISLSTSTPHSTASAEVP